MEKAKYIPSVEFLSVPSVEEIASNLDGNGVIPQRYIRPEIEADVVVNVDTVELPVIDMERLLNPQLSAEEIAKLDYACENWGFFQLINHGVPDRVIEQMKVDMEGFFKLPLEQKAAIAIPPNGMEGFGQHFVMSADQKLDWADLLFLATTPVRLRDLKFWPTQPPTFRDTISEYSEGMKEVTIRLLGAMSKSLGLEPHIFMRYFEELPQTMRFNHYPPCSEAKKVLGLSPHSDSGSLTLLLQVNDVQGLQIKKNGEWVAVKPIPGAFIVNVGDIVEILTNGKYKSIEHRATIDTQKERFSIATFHLSSSSFNIGPIPEFVGDGSKNYKTTMFTDYRKNYLAAKLSGKNHLQNMKYS